MSSNVVNQQPYLKTTKNFSDTAPKLSLEMNITYLETASAINNRIIGIFPTNRPAITGENWYFDKARRQQSLRQVYVFESTASIPHGLNLSQIDRFSHMYGAYTDDANWYGLIAASDIAIIGQISFYLDPVNIVFMTGAGAPTLTRGNLVLQWLSDV